MQINSVLSKIILWVSALIISSYADTKMSSDLTLLVSNAQKDGWVTMPDTNNNSIKMTKTLTDTRMMTGVHTRWNRVTETVDATAVVTESKGKILITQTSAITNPRLQKQFYNAIASLQKTTSPIIEISGNN